MNYKSTQLIVLLWLGALLDALFLVACKREENSTTQPPNVDAVISTPPVLTDTISRLVLFENNTNGIAQFRIPAFVKTTKGTLIAVCDARVNKLADLPNKINLVARISKDDGRTWSDMKIIFESIGDDGASNPSLIMDKKTNTVWLFFNYAKAGIGGINSQPGFGDSTIHILAIKSSDDGLTWSKPIDITRSVKDKNWSYVFSSPGHGIQLKDGTLVQTAYFAFPKSVTWETSSFVFYSKDFGKTWKRTLPISKRCDEAMAVELERGEVMVNMRNQGKRLNGGTRRAVALSSDLSMPWSAVHYDTALVEPTCQGSILKLEYGEAAGKDWLVFTNPAHPVHRKNLTLRFSKNGGNQWTSSLQLWPNGSMYSDIVELGNGDIGVLYEKYVSDSFYLEFARVPRKLIIK